MGDLSQEVANETVSLKPTSEGGATPLTQGQLGAGLPKRDDEHAVQHPWGYFRRIFARVG